MSKTQKMTRREAGRFMGRFKRMTVQECTCEHGHFACSVTEGGPCHNEVLATFFPEENEKDTQDYKDCRVIARILMRVRGFTVAGAVNEAIYALRRPGRYGWPKVDRDELEGDLQEAQDAIDKT